MDVNELGDALQRAYLSRRRGPAKKKKVPDFREYDGVSLKKTGHLLTREELRLPVGELAEVLAQEAIDWEQSQLQEAGYDATSIFLKNYELPNVFKLRDGSIKFRHVFAARPAQVAA